MVKASPKFLITRFTHGSGGKFLSTVMQTSDTVWSWNYALNIDPLTYTASCFPMDHSQHLRSEPMVCYNTDLYSSTYPRGNEVTLDQYMRHAQSADPAMQATVHHGKFANLIFNKPQLPRFCENSCVVTITVNSDRELRWLENTLWSKHFVETDDKIIYAPHHPEYCHNKSVGAVLSYNNPCEFELSERDFLWNRYVKNNPTRLWYTDPGRFVAHDVELGLNNVYFPLECFFDVELFLYETERLFTRFGLGDPDLDLIEQMLGIWQSRQLPFD